MQTRTAVPAPNQPPALTPTSSAQRTIGIQAGHGDGDAGASLCPGADKVPGIDNESDLNLAIANKVVELLRNANGYNVNLYKGKDSKMKGLKADAFVAIHADQGKPGVSGYKVSRFGGGKGTGLDGSGDASDGLVQAIWDEYGNAAGLTKDTSPGHFTEDMLYYYALGWIDTSTPGAIIEMGWLCDDLGILLYEQERVALGISRGIIRFLGDDIAQLPFIEVTPRVPMNTPVAGEEDRKFKIALLRQDGTLVLSDINGNTLGEMQTGIFADLIRDISWSPNGRYLLVLANSGSQNSTWLVDTETKEAHKWLEPIVTEFQYRWSPISDRLSVNTGYGSGTQLDIVSIYGTERKTIYQGWMVNNTPTWSPNGQHLAVAGSPSQSPPFHLYLVNADTGETKDITPLGFEITGFSDDWLPDGRFIFASVEQSETILQVLDPATGNVAPLLKNPPEGHVGWPNLSPSGTMVAYPVMESNGSWSLYIENLQTNQRQLIWSVDAAVDVYPASWSPSEDYLVFALQTDRQGLDIQTFLVELSNRQEQLLPGVPIWLLQSSDIYSASKGWINDELLVVAQRLDQNGYRFALLDVNGNELQELCNIGPRDRRCAFWTP